MLARDGHPTPLAQAFAEYGRIAKSLRLGLARDDSQYLAANRGAAGPDEEPVGREGPP
jgi:hypothetical protein